MVLRVPAIFQFGKTCLQLWSFKQHLVIGEVQGQLQHAVPVAEPGWPPEERGYGFVMPVHFVEDADAEFADEKGGLGVDLFFLVETHHYEEVDCLA